MTGSELVLELCDLNNNVLRANVRLLAWCSSNCTVNTIEPAILSYLYKISILLLYISETCLSVCGSPKFGPQFSV